MKTLQLTFNNKTFFTTSINHEGQEFFNLNDIFNASTEIKASKRPKNWRNQLSRRYEAEGKKLKLTGAQKCTTVKIMSHGGAINDEAWHGTQEVVIAYAQWLQPDFAYVVNKAFSLLVDGKTDEALSLAQSVASFHRENARESYKQLTEEIDLTIDDELYSFSKLNPTISYRNFSNLIWKYATGKPLPKPAPKGLRDSLVEQGLAEEALRLDTGTQIVMGGLRAKLPYDTIKLMLNIQ
ncbi:KilA-N domain-containing protein [Vibrio cholerae]